MKLATLISIVMIGSLIVGVHFDGRGAGAPVMARQRSHFGLVPHRPDCGFGGCRRHWHHGLRAWGGALAGAANRDNYELAIHHARAISSAIVKATAGH